MAFSKSHKSRGNLEIFFNQNAVLFYERTENDMERLAFVVHLIALHIRPSYMGKNQIKHNGLTFSNLHGACGLTIF